MVGLATARTIASAVDPLKTANLLMVGSIPDDGPLMVRRR
jgi:hypothetical protein